MYNQEIKERFIRETVGNKPSNIKKHTDIFDTIGKTEREKQLDIAQMNIQDAAASLCGGRTLTYTGVFSKLSVVRKYIAWCQQAGVFDYVNSEIADITINDVDISHVLHDRLFLNECDMIQVLRKLRPFDEGYYEVIAMLLYWEGITTKQIRDIKISDVDLDARLVFVKDFENPISLPQEVADIMRIYSTTKTAIRGVGNGFRTVYRDDSYDMFVRKFTSSKKLGGGWSPSNLDDTICALNSAYVANGGQAKFTASNIQASGAMNRVWQLEQSGIDVLAMKNKDVVLNAYRMKEKIHEVLWQYRNYKKAFNL